MMNIPMRIVNKIENLDNYYYEILGKKIILLLLEFENDIDIDIDNRYIYLKDIIKNFYFLKMAGKNISKDEYKELENKLNSIGKKSIKIQQVVNYICCNIFNILVK